MRLTSSSYIVSAVATPAAVLSDFGGVLTSSVPDAFSKASRLLGGGPDLLSRLFHEDAGAARLLVDHECGRISESEFDAGIRECLRGRGIDAAGARVVSVIQEALTPDERMLGALVALRERGIPVALVTNSLGDDAYRGYDLDALADVVVISGQVGTRKPSSSSTRSPATDSASGPNQPPHRRPTAEPGRCRAARRPGDLAPGQPHHDRCPDDLVRGAHLARFHTGCLRTRRVSLSTSISRRRSAQ